MAFKMRGREWFAPPPPPLRQLHFKAYARPEDATEEVVLGSVSLMPDIAESISGLRDFRRIRVRQVLDIEERLDLRVADIEAI